MRAHDHEVIVLAEFHREDLCPDLTPESDPEGEPDGVGPGLAWRTATIPPGGPLVPWLRPVPSVRKRYSTRSPVLRC